VTAAASVTLPLLIAVVVASAIAAGARHKLARLEERVAVLDRRQQDASQRERLLSGVVARGFAGSHNSLTFSAGVIDRLIQQRMTEIDPSLARHQLARLSESLERARAEALIMADDAVGQRSAIQQLSNGLGDADTARFLAACAECGDLSALSDGAIREAIALVHSHSERDRDR